MIEALLQSPGSASVNTRNGNNYTPIEVAVLWGNLAAVRLLEHRQGVDMKPGTEDNSLEIAREEGYGDIVECLEQLQSESCPDTGEEGFQDISSNETVL